MNIRQDFVRVLPCKNLAKLYPIRVSVPVIPDAGHPPNEGSCQNFTRMGDRILAANAHCRAASREVRRTKMTILANGIRSE